MYKKAGMAADLYGNDPIDVSELLKIQCKHFTYAIATE